MLWQILVFMTIIWTVIYRWKTRKLRALWNKLPCDIPDLPIIGHAHMFIGSDVVRMSTWQKFGREALKHGGLTRLKMGSQFTVVADPVDAEFVTKNILEKDDVMGPIKFYIGNGSVSAPVHIWRPRRKIIVSAFNHNKIMKFVDIFAQKSKILVEKLSNVAEKGALPLWDYLNKYTMDSICETNLGVQVHAQKQDHPFLEAFESCLHSLSERICQPWLQIDFVYKLLGKYSIAEKDRDVMNNFIFQVIDDKRTELKNSKNNTKEIEYDPTGKKTECLMELLISTSSSEGGVGYTDNELREELLVIAMAGTDTTAVGLAFTLVLLAKYPEVQEKLYKELQDWFKGSERTIASDDLVHLKYLDAVIKESLRVYSPIPVTVRKVTKDITLPSGVTVVEGSGILLNFWAIHRNPKYWGEDAEDFRPERFLEGPLKHPAAFIPFSYGPRNCVGYQYAMLSLKTSVASLVRMFRIIEPSNSKKNLRLKFDVMMKDDDNYIVEIENR